MLIFVIVLINLFVILYVYKKFYKLETTNKCDDEIIKKYDSMILGYINDGKINNNFDLIYAEIVNLNIRGLLKIEYLEDGYNYKIKANYDFETENVKKYELIVLEYLFSQKSELNKEDLEEKLKNTFSSYNMQFSDLYDILKQNLIENEIIDKNKESNIYKINKKYKKFSIIAFIIAIILSMITNIKVSFICMNIFIIECFIVKYILNNSNIYTKKGNMIKNTIEEYKEKLKNKEFIIDKTNMNNIVMSQEFANSLALHIKTQAKKYFINEEMQNSAKIKTKKSIAIIIILFIIIVMIGVMLGNITVGLDKNGIALLYGGLAIIVAFIVDVAYILSKGKK